MLPINSVWHGDCLELMEGIPDKSVDMILCDPPYGKTSAKWDSVLDFDKLFFHYNRIIKPKSAILIFGSEPFSSKLRLVNIKNYKYDWIWVKNRGTKIASAKFQPTNGFEKISVFNSQFYFPIKERTKSNHIYKCAEKGLKRNTTTNSEQHNLGGIYGGDFQKEIYPTGVLNFNTVNNRDKERFHSSQKPIDLLEYLIKTYSQENDLILDNCAGSGSTLVAAKNLNRKFIGIEKEKEYYDICLERLGLK